MACRQQKRKVFMRRRLHILRALTCSKFVTRLSIIMDALLYIYNLKLKLEKTMKECLNLIATRRSSYLNLLKLEKEVRVEKLGNNEFVIRVICERKGNHFLVSILEVFEEMGVFVLQARVSCNYHFSMEAIVVASNDLALEVRDITQAILKAIGKPVGEGVVSSND